MMNRRTFVGMLAGSTAVLMLGCTNTIMQVLGGRRKQGITALYRSVGERLDHF